MTDQDVQQETVVQKVSPGGLLARARNSQGFSIAEIAENLKITENYVKAIEESAFDALPQPAFVRGYIRNYARLVGLNGEELVKDFDRFIGNDGLDAPRLQGARKIKPLRAHRTPASSLALALLLVVSLGGLSYYFWNHWLDAEAVVDPVVGIAMVEDISAELPEEPPVFGESMAPIASEAATAMEKNPVIDDTAAVTEDEAIQQEMSPELLPVPEDAEVVGVTPGDGTKTPMAEYGKPLVIDFSADCWVEIKDATGEVLISAVQKAGSSINLDVFPPVSVRFGNTQGVKSILLDGQPMTKPTSSTRVASVLLTGNGQG